MAIWLKAALAAPLILSAAPLPDAPRTPARFQGEAVAVVVFVEPERIDQVCGKAAPGKVRLACHYRNKDGVSVIYMPNACPLAEAEFYAFLMCHEVGHARGWSGSHEL